jgi:hypothetical protein
MGSALWVKLYYSENWLNGCGVSTVHGDDHDDDNSVPFNVFQSHSIYF